MTRVLAHPGGLPLAAVEQGPLQHRKVASCRRGGAHIVLGVAAAVEEGPLQHFRVAAFRGVCANAGRKPAALGMCPP